MMRLKTILLLSLMLGACCKAAPDAPIKADKEEERDYVRVEREKDAILLQTSIVKMKKDGVTVDLLGAIHIADGSYYQELKERFTKYDRLLFEMIGGDVLEKRRADAVNPANLAEGEEAAKKEKSELSGLTFAYSKAAQILALQLQHDGIDYLAKNFVHADLTMKEFQAKQEERKESLLSFAIKTSVASMFKPGGRREPNSYMMTLAFIQGDGTAMKRELIDTMGTADDQVTGFAGKSVILNDRNDKCLEVLAREIAAGHKKLGIFYGAAHFPAMEKELLKQGWQRASEEWLTAWNVPKAKKYRIKKADEPKK